KWFESFVVRLRHRHWHELSDSIKFETDFHKLGRFDQPCFAQCDPSHLSNKRGQRGPKVFPSGFASIRDFLPVSSLQIKPLRFSRKIHGTFGSITEVMTALPHASNRSLAF